MNYRQIVSSLNECVVDEIVVKCDACKSPATKTLSHKNAWNPNEWVVGWYCNRHYDYYEYWHGRLDKAPD